MADRPNERILKISYALRRRGISTSALFRSQTQKFDLEKFFDFVRLEPDISEIVRIVQRHPSDFIHVYSLLADEVSVRVLQNSGKKIVIDMKDIIIGQAEKVFRADFIAAHKYLISSSTGLLMRDLSAIYAKSQGLRLPSKRTFFLDYAWSRDLLPKEPTTFSPNDIPHLCFIGQFNSELSRPDLSGTGIFHVMESLVQQGFRVSTFPSSPVFSQDLSHLKQLMTQTDRFFLSPTVHDPLVLGDVLNKIPNAVGIAFCQSYEFPNLPAPFTQAAYDRVGISSRFYTFVGSGVPILWSEMLAGVSKFAGNRGLCVVVEQGGFRKLADYLSVEKIQYVAKRVEESRWGYLNIDKNIDKLIRFYRSL